MSPEQQRWLDREFPDIAALARRDAEIQRFILALWDQAYQEGSGDGYDLGRSDGYNDGHEDGKAEAEADE